MALLEPGMVCICARKKYQFGGRAQSPVHTSILLGCKLTAAWCTVFFDLSEQEIDGETLLMLCKTGTIDQLKACGLETVKDQLKLKRLIQGSEKTSVVAVTEQVACGTSCIELNRKLSLSELGKISPEDRRIYLMM